MRLLLITNRYPVDADDPASPFVPHFAQALRSCGVRVDILTPHYGPSSDPHPRPLSLRGRGEIFGNLQTPSLLDGEATSVHRFETGTSTPVGSWNLLNPGSWLRLVRFVTNGLTIGEELCRRDRYNHILALWALPSGHFAQVLSRRFHVPYSVWCLGSDIYIWAKRPFVRSRITNILRGAAHVFGDGENLCCRIRDRLGVEATFLPSFRPLSGLGDCRPPQPTDVPRFLYLGRLHRAKGVFNLLAAFAGVRKVLPRATLRYVGNGPAETKLRVRVANLGLGQGVFLGGAVTQERLVQRLVECDCVVIPTQSDSIPLVFGEAVQAMRPVIGTDVGDLGACIQRYRVGSVTPSVEPSDLAATMLSMARSPVFDLLGRDQLLRHFDPRRAAQMFCARAVRLTGTTPPSSARERTSTNARTAYIP